MLIPDINILLEMSSFKKCLMIEKKNHSNYLFGALHEARTLDGVATVFAAHSVVIIAAVGIVIFVLFPHHPVREGRENNGELTVCCLVEKKSTRSYR